MEQWRVEELAERAGASVELIRSYQSKGLLPPPRHEGRVAYYGPRHLDRLRRIRDLKSRGHSLRAVAAMLNEAEPALSPVPPPEDDERLTIAELAELTGVPVPLLRSLEGSGVLRPARSGREEVYSAADVRAVRMLLVLVGSGVPMDEFMSVARVQLASARTVAEGAVALFMRYIREPLRAARLPQAQEAERLVASFRLLAKAASGLIAYNFERMLLESVQAELERHGTRAEKAAIRREADRRNDVA